MAVTACWGLLTDWPREAALLLDIYDPERVELSNLNRQFLFSAEEIGTFKSEALVRKFLYHTSLIQGKRIELRSHPFAVQENNILEALNDASFVLDCCDCSRTKFLINDFCVSNSIPFCYAGAVGEVAQVLLVRTAKNTHLGGNSGCLRCLFGELSVDEIAAQTTSCQAAGILGPIAGYAGLLQAEHTLEHLFPTAGSKQVAGTLFRISSTDFREQPAVLRPAIDCPLGCGKTSLKLLDLRDKSCPNTFIYTKLALEQLSGTETLDVRFSSQESAKNVRQTVEEDDYGVPGKVLQLGENLWRLLIDGRKLDAH